jgi:peptidoglycan/xylan/chitin deacetylase (PgdA/CDA1 family)
VALTFDDGPDPRFTPFILDALSAARARATFFFSGEAIERHPELARRAAVEHEIGTHLYSHDRSTSRSIDRFRAELDRAVEVHRRVLGKAPAALRFPFGDPGSIRRRHLRALGVTAYHWTFSSEDASASTGEEIVGHVTPRLHSGAIVLLHDGRGPNSTKGTGSRQPTVDAVPLVLRAIERRGLRPVTLDEMFRRKA